MLNVYFNEDSGNAVFPCNEMGIVNKDVNNINLDDTNYAKNDPDTIIHIRLSAWRIKLEKCKALRKELNEELMHIASHNRRWQNFLRQEKK